MAHLDEAQLRALGFAQVGQGVKISPLASFHNPAAIHLGDHVRIDDFCVLSAGSGGIHIGRNVHIGAGSTLIGAGRITLGDFSNISSRVAIYSSNDDYSGEWMSNPTVPSEFTHAEHAPVLVGRHCIVACGAVVLPGVVLGEGVVIGALSLVKQSCEAFGVYAGVPCRRIGSRSCRLLEREQQWLGREREAT